MNVKVPKVIEIGRDAIWSVSSSSYSHGVKNLVDGNTDTFWQSTGVTPHNISITFPRVTKVKRVDLFIDFKKDESFTPKKIVIYTGSCQQDRMQAVKIEVNEPCGWIPIHVGNKGYIRTHFLQVCFVSNHNLGRDSRVRQMKVFGPESESSYSAKIKNVGLKKFCGFR